MLPTSANTLKGRRVRMVASLASLIGTALISVARCKPSAQKCSIPRSPSVLARLPSWGCVQPMRAQAGGEDSEPTYSDAARARREDRKLIGRSRVFCKRCPSLAVSKKLRGESRAAPKDWALQARTRDAAAKLW